MLHDPIGRDRREVLAARHRARRGQRIVSRGLAELRTDGRRRRRSRRGGGLRAGRHRRRTRDLLETDLTNSAIGLRLHGHRGLERPRRRGGHRFRPRLRSHRAPRGPGRRCHHCHCFTRRRSRRLHGRRHVHRRVDSMAAVCHHEFHVVLDGDHGLCWCQATHEDRPEVAQVQPTVAIHRAAAADHRTGRAGQISNRPGKLAVWANARVAEHRGSALRRAGLIRDRAHRLPHLGRWGFPRRDFVAHASGRRRRFGAGRSASLGRGRIRVLMIPPRNSQAAGVQHAQAHPGPNRSRDPQSWLTKHGHPPYLPGSARVPAPTEGARRNTEASGSIGLRGNAASAGGA